MNRASFSLNRQLFFKVSTTVHLYARNASSARCLRRVLNKAEGLRTIKTHGFVRSYVGEAKSRLDHMCNIDITSKTRYTRLATIICTIGPSSREVATLEKLVEAGMGVARINCTRGSRDYQIETIANVRKAVENYSRKIGRPHPVAIAIETKKTGIITGSNEDGVKLEAGARLRLTTDEKYVDKCTSEIIYVNYGDITKVVKVGVRMYLDYGRFSFVVTAIGSDYLECVVENGGVLRGNKDINIPGVMLDFPTVRDKVKSDVDFGREQDVDMFIASYITSADMIHGIRHDLGERGKHVMIVAKVENRLGFDNVDEIIAAADGVVVGRGSLAPEIGYAGVFTAQTSIMARCNRAGKPVICANHMLESMVEKPRATRAEVSDIGNAIVAGADCVMLTAETEIGDFPVESLVTMDRVCREAEATMWQRQRFSDLARQRHFDADQCVAIAAVRASYLCAATAIVALSVTGRSARLVAGYRPMCPVVAISRSARVARQNRLYRALLPVVYARAPLADWFEDRDERVAYALEVGLERDVLREDGMVVVVTCWDETSSYLDMVHVMPVTDLRLIKRPRA